MSLTGAIRTAQNSLLNTARQTLITSRNISEASNENYVRRDAILTTVGGSTRLASIRRNTSEELFRHSLQALSDSSAQSLISDAGTRLQRLVNGVDNTTAPATLISDFENALQLYSSDPSNTLLASSAVNYAKELASGINSAALSIQEYRASVDQDIADSIDELNNLMDSFKKANDEVVKGTAAGTDVNDAYDERDTLLKQISEYVSVSVVKRSDNDMALYTSQGVTLFETVPRNITFDPLSSYSAGVIGNPIRIDGVPIIGGNGGNTNSTGTLAAQVQMRDEVAVQLQSQLDEIARGLVTTFAETDTTGGGAPALAGLFTYSGGPAIPAPGTVATGISLSLSVNGAFDPVVGGNPELLRDGGANGLAYVSNTTGGTGFSERLINYLEAMDNQLPTDITAGIAGTYSVSGYAESSLGWLESLRSVAQSASESKSALYTRLSGDHFAETGVNIDEEMSILIDLEQSYQASARIISVVDQMLEALLAAVR
jgi:flagellar hook-associated protein 1